MTDLHTQNPPDMKVDNCRNDKYLLQAALHGGQGSALTHSEKHSSKALFEEP